MALKALNLTLGSLIQCFKRERIGEKEVEMTEGRGTLVPKTILLVCIYSFRNIQNASIFSMCVFSIKGT